MRTIAAFVLSMLPVLAFGATLCTQEEAAGAESVVPGIESWASMHRAFQTYGHCDDGSIAEGFSEVVARLFTVAGHRVGELDRLAKSDAAFRAFVLRHVDATLTARQLADIDREVQTACPVDASDLCRDVSSSAMRAHQEQKR